MLTNADFRPVRLEDREFFTGHYARYPQEHSDNTFTNMVCWNHYASYEYASIRGSVVLKSTIEGRSRYRVPIGPADPDLMADVIECAVRTGDETPLAILDTRTKAAVTAAYPSLPLEPVREYFEYVYRTSDLATLPGKPYLKIRNQLNRFRRKCNYSIGMVTDESLPEMEEFLLEWCDWKDCEGNAVLENEKAAVLYAARNFSALGLSGVEVRVDGRVAAIALYEGMNADTALVHFEKGLPDCEGIYKAVNMETAKDLAGRYPYVNRESDLGDPGLREAKQRYHPDHMVEVYRVRRDDLLKLDAT
jgi:hypothetical protein